MLARTSFKIYTEINVLMATGHRVSAAQFSTTIKNDRIQVDHLVIGAGVVGLSIAERLSRHSTASTLLLDQHSVFGNETSSRNSQVIHAGIYYPDDSLKTKLCIRGRELMYDLCNKNNIPFKKIGKWIVAVSQQQTEDLHALQKKAHGLGVETFFLTKKAAIKEEPHVSAYSVLASPTTGILDVHRYMQYLENAFIDQGGTTSYHSLVSAIEKHVNGGYLVTIRSSDGSHTQIVAGVLVNAAGLYATNIASMLMPPSQTASLQMHYCKGHYFSYRRSNSPVSRLIYPLPEKNVQSLGIHCTLDLEGRLKFGPDVLFIDNCTDYSMGSDCDDGGAVMRKFHQAITLYMPMVNLSDLKADFVGIRPKLSGPGEPFRDFVIEIPDELPGFVNLIGIESPGLTSSQAIAEHVHMLLFGK
ncbi:hypothetical protein BDV3_005291 [Batrachochytrium dendrobatidis]|nr:hypothetical protein BDEG_23304 [Batrachochytrium dendrobatidis JEL423]